LGTLALSPGCQGAQISEIKNEGWTWMAKCNELTRLPFKGLNMYLLLTHYKSLVRIAIYL